MFAVFLLAAAVSIVAVALLFLFWRNVDRRVQLAYGDENVEDLTERLEEALEQQQQLTSRIEHLEAIIAAEPWEAALKQRMLPPAQAEEEPVGKSQEEKATQPDRRQQSR